MYCGKRQMTGIASALKVAFFFAIFHGRLRTLIVGAGTALRLAGCRDFGNNRVECIRCRQRCSSARCIADGAEANRHILYLFIGLDLNKVGHRHDYPLPDKAVALV